MPNNTIKSFADKSGESIERVEELWKKAKALVKKEYNIDDESEKFYPLVTGILKRMLKINEEGEPSITTTSVGNASSEGGSANFASYFNMSRRNEPVKKKKKKKKNESFLDRLDFYLED